MKVLLVVLVNIFFVSNVKSEEDIITKAKKILEDELFSRELELSLNDLHLPLKEKKSPPKTTTTLPPPTTSKPIKTVDESSLSNNHHVDSCFDVYSTRKCGVLINNHLMDCDKDRMKELCKASCGLCGKPPVLTDCSTTKFGCCETDAKVAKNDAAGSNCPACQDKRSDLCTSYESDCNEIGMVGEWMRKNCAKTCHQCHVPEVKKCLDDEEHSEYCPFWKEEGLCSQVPDLMKAHCAKTCDYC